MLKIQVLTEIIKDKISVVKLSGRAKRKYSANSLATVLSLANIFRPQGCWIA